LEIHQNGSGNLLGSHCLSCGAYFFPVREACAGCLSDDLETVGFSTEGILYTYSVVRQSTPAFKVPYALGYVDFPEGVRIMGQISGCELEDIHIGMPVVLALEPFGEDEDGNPLTGYRFRPAEASND
jgi:uncharacterized OB-fold protein